MSLPRIYHGISDSIKELGEHWQGDMETGFPARINAVRKDGVTLWYLPSDEVEHDRYKAKCRDERLTKLILDMHSALKQEGEPCRLYGLHEKLAKFEDRMEALGIDVDE